MRPPEVVPLHLADVTYPHGHPLAGTDGPVFAFAIRHREGLVLVDTGIGAGNSWIEEHYRPRRREVRDALAAASLDPDTVRLVINTHLHFDHCGQNRAFAGIRTVVQRAELDAAHGPDYTIGEWFDFAGARHDVVEGDHEVFGGVSVLATPGHTAGHQSVVVRTGDGLVLIAGQAAQDARAFAAGEANESVRRLRALNADRVHFSHDRAILRRRPAATRPPS